MASFTENSPWVSHHGRMKSTAGNHPNLLGTADISGTSATAGVATAESNDAETRATVAHVLRRLTFTPNGDRVAQLVDKHGAKAPQAAITGILESSRTDQLPKGPTSPDEGDQGAIAGWWVDLMSETEHPLVERMTWFWHGHLTSSFVKVGTPAMMYRQNQLIRKFALGNFKELMHQLTIDAAMLVWLDGNWSTGEEPNENYARELMELFTLGRGNYNEADVRAAAKGLAGYGVGDEPDYTVDFAEDRAFPGEVTLLGKTARFDANAVIDIVLDQPACAPFVTGKLYRYFMGVDAPEDRSRELAELFRRDFEIRPVVENIVLHPSFVDPAIRYNRIRNPVEWRAAASAALKLPIDWGTLWDMGQVPFYAPNVAGWPDDRRWLAAGPTLARAQTARDRAWDSLVVDTEDPVAWALEQAALFDASSATFNAIKQSVDPIDSRRDRITMAMSLALLCPEFILG
jgi:uncharacterized protein (DUF1800 family)